MREGLRYIVLSGEHRTLPRAEVIAIAEAEDIDLRVTEELDQLMIVEAGPRIHEVLRRRAALAKFGGDILRVFDLPLDAEELRRLFKDVGTDKLRVEFTRLRGYGRAGIRYSDVVDVARGAGLRTRGGEGVVDVVVAGGALIVGLRMFEVREAWFRARDPPKRPVYMPGTMTAKLSRVFVNLSRVKRGRLLYDPFCGVGSMLIEACVIGSRPVGVDIDERRVVGAAINMEYYGCSPAVIASDVCGSPVWRADAVATDPPYGRMTRAEGTDIWGLMNCFLDHLADALVPGGYGVFAQALEYVDDEAVEERGLKIIEVHRNWVHGSLVREIYVVRK